MLSKPLRYKELQSVKENNFISTLMVDYGSKNYFAVTAWASSYEWVVQVAIHLSTIVACQWWVILLKYLIMDRVQGKVNSCLPNISLNWVQAGTAKIQTKLANSLCIYTSFSLLGTNVQDDEYKMFAINFFALNNWYSLEVTEYKYPTFSLFNLD